MKQAIFSAAVAAVVSAVIVLALGGGAPESSVGPRQDTSSVPPAVPPASSGVQLSYTDPLVEDVWINAARGGTGDDHRSLTDADNSICFITKIEIGGIQSANDTSSCVMRIDDFTGFWDLVATVEEGGQSQIRCNARCLVWQQE